MPISSFPWFTFVDTSSTFPGAQSALAASALADLGYDASELREWASKLTAAHSMETVSLRIARVLGPGAKNTGSPWRSQIFERPSPSSNRLTISFAPEAKLSVIHVEDLARALRMLIEVPNLPRPIYNAPAELVRADEIKRLAERVNGWQISQGTYTVAPKLIARDSSKTFNLLPFPSSNILTTPPS